MSPCICGDAGAARRKLGACMHTYGFGRLAAAPLLTILAAVSCGGDAGVDGSEKPGPTDPVGQPGPADPPGDGGDEAGVERLVRKVPIPVGTREDCGGGGVEVLSGFDLDRDGTLDDAEVEERNLVCGPAPCDRIRFSANVQSACVTSQAPWLTIDSTNGVRLDITDSGYLFVALPAAIHRYSPAGTGRIFFNVSIAGREFGDIEAVGDSIFFIEASTTGLKVATYSNNGDAFAGESGEAAGAILYRSFTAIAQNDWYFGAGAPSTAPIRRKQGQLPSGPLMTDRPTYKLQYDPVKGRLYFLDGADATVRFLTLPDTTVKELGALPVAAGSLADDLTTDEDGRVYVSCVSGAAACAEGSVFRLEPVSGASEVLLGASVVVRAITYHPQTKMLYVGHQQAAQLAIERVSIQR
jgi:hypothetical protein